VFTTIKLHEPLPDDLFKFEPPPGARKRENQR
jgi:outer membrane lipoprotein-sorting protein